MQNPHHGIFITYMRCPNHLLADLVGVLSAISLATPLHLSVPGPQSWSHGCFIVDLWDPNGVLDTFSDSTSIPVTHSACEPLQLQYVPTVQQTLLNPYSTRYGGGQLRDLVVEHKLLSNLPLLMEHPSLQALHTCSGPCQGQLHCRGVYRKGSLACQPPPLLASVAILAAAPSV